MDKMPGNDEPSPTSAESQENVSNNAKVVLLALFILVGAVLAIFGVVSWIRGELSDSLVTVFSVAVTGCFTLGGTLITTLWGK